MAWWDKLLKVGGAAAAPFTGGLSLPLAIGIAGAGAVGGALSNKKSNKTSTSKSTSLVNPIENPAYSPLENLLLEQALGRLKAGGLPGGFIEGGIQNINESSDLAEQSLQNRLTASGLSRSPAAVPALTNLDTTRMGLINRFQNIDAPLLERELADRDFGNALNLFGARRTGTETTTTGEQVGAGSPLSGAFTSAAELLAYLYGSGSFGGGAVSGKPSANVPARFPGR